MATKNRNLQKRKTFVYVAKNTSSRNRNKVKVGITHDIDERMRNIKSVAEFTREFPNRELAREAERFLLKKFENVKVPKGRAPGRSREYLYLEAEDVIRALKRFSTGGSTGRSDSQQKSESKTSTTTREETVGKIHVVESLWNYPDGKRRKTYTSCGRRIKSSLTVVKSKGKWDKVMADRRADRRKDICKICLG